MTDTEATDRLLAAIKAALALLKAGHTQVATGLLEDSAAAVRDARKDA
jgi:hypothetical protein